MKKALLILTSLFAAPAFAGFDVNDARILGQYEMVQASPDAEIDSVKIIYNHDGELVLVRDEETEWPLSSADKNGIVYQGEDEPNPGSGDEPNCYYDASIVVKLTEGKNARGQRVPQVIIEIDRVDAYEAEPDYSYQVVFNWSAPIEDAVPFYYNMENPADLKALDDVCRTQFGVITGSEYAHNRVCLTADAFQIRAGIDPKKAFANLANKYERAQSLNKADLEKIFADSDLYIRNEAKRYKTPNSAEALITAALPLRQFIQDKATALAYVPGSLAWLFVLDADSGVMYQFAVFTK